MKSLARIPVFFWLLALAGIANVQEGSAAELPRQNQITTAENTNRATLSQNLSSKLFSALAGLDLSGFIVLEPQYIEARTNTINPGDFFQIDGPSMEAATIFDARSGGFSARARTTAKGPLNHGNWPQIKDVQLLEFQYSRPLSDRLYASIGKRIISWDTGFSAQPLGFFQADKSLSDLTDEAGRESGLPLISLSWLGDDWSGSVVYSDDFGHSPDGGRRGLKQWAARITKQIGAADVSLVTQKSNTTPLGFGGSFESAIGNDFTVHASGFIGKGRLVRRPQFISDISQTGQIDQTFGIQRLPKTSINTVFGIVFTPNSSININAEYFHNGKGLNGAQWQTFTDNISNFRDAFDTGRDALAPVNLGLAGQVLSSAQIRKNYAYLSLGYSLKKVSFSQATLVNLDDVSRILISQISYKPSSQWDLSGVVQQLDGNNRTEYGLSPVKFQSYIRLRRQF